MDMTGERRIAAPRQVVWDALNDTTTLKASIPGCETLEKTDDTHMKATAAVKLGPISARFNGAVTLSDINAPNSYTITGEGQGGVAGFAKGGAKVFLTDDAGATLLKYEVNAQVGGKLAQQFFTKFSDDVQKLVPAEAAPATPVEIVPSPIAPPSAISPLALIPREPFGLPVMGWIGILLFAGILLATLASLL